MDKGNAEDEGSGLDDALGEHGVDAAGLRAILNAIPQMVWTSRVDGAAEFFNDRWQDFTGIPVELADIEGRRELLHPDDRDRLRSSWSECLANGKPFEFEVRMMHHTGQYRWTLCRGMPMLDGRKVALTIKTTSPSTPVVMLTGWGTMLNEKGDLPINVDAILSKPPRPAELHETIVTVVASSLKKQAA